MRGLASVASCFAALLISCCSAKSNITSAHQSTQILPSNFKPPQVFSNVNLVRNINLEKGYSRETTNLVVENIDSKPQSEYYLPFTADTIGHVGGLEVRDKRDTSKPAYKVELVEYDSSSETQFYLIHLSPPLASKSQTTLSVSHSILSSLSPLPAIIEQADKQFLVHTFSAYFPSAYPTTKQKTKLKFFSASIPSFSKFPSTSTSDSENKEDPVKQGSTLTYGSFGAVPAGAVLPATVRYEYTKPVNVVTLLERDLEISHWGGTLATEERYLYENRGAQLPNNNFNRVKWAAQNYYNPETSALKELRIPLSAAAANPYFVDDIGNVSTSHFRSSSREGMLELRPRYPVFGGWKYGFKIGYDSPLSGALRKLQSGDGYALKVPFLEGPKQAEGFAYEKVRVRIALPEGASNVRWESSVPVVAEDNSLHRTFMDTLGRTTLTLTAVNVGDDLRDRDLIVTYDYAWIAGLRKPAMFSSAAFALFTVMWLVAQVDVGISKKKTQ